ncbi:carbohydrate kinase [Thiohalocapsa marina]|uniref:Carbohydrate kinase n=1 Tax=Thiohalocapsa marina TaxID=424902 RepID=A0A5M8FIU7_9GAMM|nr:PfkB family carbohydrate kinase [Thiohalocapsa marina]KAA6184629.1 carbohydrate kinase [Thiohalocapsa marina]
MTFDPSRPPVIFGEALFDCFPDGAEVLGGAPFNVAWHLSAFAADPLFISRVGRDALGDRIADAMAAHGMATRGLQRDPAHATGTVQVTLADGEPCYDIVPGRAYDCIDADALPDDLPAQGLLYHGTLALRAPASVDALGALRRRMRPAVFLDVNLRDPWWGADQVHGLLAAARWVKLNADELAILAPPPDRPESGRPEGSPEAQENAQDPVLQQARALLRQHGLELVFATLGAAGALAVRADGSCLRVAPAERVDVVDAVGAGDGFASVLILGLLQDWPLQQTLERAQAFASAMVGQRGATVSDAAFYHRFARAWGLR